ncbi:MAG: DUF4397 domain-containing protein [Burkholderiaceae bacterium]
MLTKPRAALALALLLPLLNGCGIDDIDAGHVRLVNATTEFGTMDLYESTTELSGGTASNAVGAYQDVDKGQAVFNVKNGGSSSTSATTTQTVSKDAHYTIVAFVNANALQTAWLTDDEPTPDPGVAKLRVFNAAPGEAAGVDVYVTTNACGALTIADTAVASDVTGLQGSYSDLTAAAGGVTANICVTATGDKGDLRLAIPSLTLTNRQVATLILTKTAGGILMNGLLLNQQGTLTGYPNSSARVRLVADAAGAGLVAATFNGTDLGSSASPNVGSYTTVGAGPVTLGLTINGTAVGAAALSTAAGGDYTLLVAGSVASPTIALLADDNIASTSTSLPVSMRLVNGLNGVGGAATLTANGSVIGGGTAFGAASAYTNVAASAGVAELTAKSGGATLWDVTAQTLTSGNVYTVFLLGDAAPASSIDGELRADND